MKNLLFFVTFMFAIIQVKAQCDITSVKVNSYGIRVFKEDGNSQLYQFDEKCIYDYSSCWLVLAKTGGNITVYDGKSTNYVKTIHTNTSVEVKSVKVLGDKVRIEYEDGSNREHNLK